MKYKSLCSAIEGLIEHLRPTGADYWIEQLTDVITGLNSDDSVNDATNKLESMFGGMCSLNDLYFCEANANLPNGVNEKEFNDKFSYLMDKTFKELRLRDSGIWTRFHWMYLEWKHRGELPPRIKKTFR